MYRNSKINFTVTSSRIVYLPLPWWHREFQIVQTFVTLFNLLYLEYIFVHFAQFILITCFLYISENLDQPCTREIERQIKCLLIKMNVYISYKFRRQNILYH